MAEILPIAQTPVFPRSQTVPQLHRRLAEQDRGRAPDRAVGPAQALEWGNS
jgi:hypothetical protein